MRVYRFSALFLLMAGLAVFAWSFATGPAATDSRAGPAGTPETYEIRARPRDTVAVTPTASLGPDADTTTFGAYDGRVSRLKLPKFGVDSVVEYIGILPNNQLDVPKDPRQTGWYEIYDKPGFPGNAVFSAHVDYFPDIIGPFNKLSQSDIGDTVIVTMEDGREYRYKVIFVARYNVDTIPMGDIVWPQDRPATAEWVTLITCGGEFRPTSVSGAGEYLQRDVVVAEREYS